MKKDRNKGSELPREYDFSKGVRGKYVGRLGGTDAPWIAEMAARDTERWIAESLLRFQRIEGHLVAYFALLHKKDAQEAGIAASQALENPGSPSFLAFLRDLQNDPAVTDDWVQRLSQLFIERNWLVHRAFYSSQSDPHHFVSRVSQAATQALTAEPEIYRFLLARCGSIGIPRHEAENRAAKIVEEWAAA